MGKRLGARAIDTFILGICCALPFVFVDADRPAARVLLALVVATAYETVFVVQLGATPGKLVAGTRVIELDLPRVTPGAATKRGLAVALCTPLVVLLPILVLAGAGALVGGEPAGAAAAGAASLLGVGVLVSVFGSKLRRGFYDRTAGTYVVDRGSPQFVASSTIDALADRQRPPTPTAWGPAATLDERRRARASRLDDSPLLVLAILAVAFAGSVSAVPIWVLVLLGVGWVAAFVADETWRIARDGSTAGHRREGLIVVDRRTGEAPEAHRALARAVLVALPLYVVPGLFLVGLAVDGATGLVLVTVAPLLEVALLLWPRFQPGRSLHDLAGGTVVVRRRAPEEG